MKYNINLPTYMQLQWKVECAIWNYMYFVDMILHSINTVVLYGVGAQLIVSWDLKSYTAHTLCGKV